MLLFLIILIEIGLKHCTPLCDNFFPKIIGGSYSDTYLNDFDVVSINMAKNQNLALNIQKLSGQCGKLMCCLKYEDENYKCMKKDCPKQNELIDYNGKKYTTIEGNVGIGGGKQGVGSYNRSILVEGLIGFIDYFPDRSPEFDSSFISAMKSAKITDASKNAVVRGLPGDDIIGGDSATSAGEEEDKKSSPGGLLGKIVSGARKFTSIGRKEEDGGDDSISAKDAVEAFGRVTGK
jgi:hypothetical protein